MRIEKDQWITLGVVVLMAVLFVSLIWMPANKRRADLDRRIDKARHELGLASVDRNEVSQWHTRVVSLREQINGAQQYVPQRNELGEVLQGINEALAENGVTEQEVVARDPKAFAHYSVIPVTMEFHSSFPVVFGSLERLEAMSRLIRIDKLHLQADLDEPSEPLEVLLEMSTFYSQVAGGER